VTESIYYLLDTIVKIFALLATIAGSIFAYNQYFEQKEREFKKNYIERQLGVVDKVFELVTEAENSDDRTRKTVAKKFFMLYQGPAKLYLGKETYTVLTNQVAVYFNTCISKMTLPSCPNVAVDCSISPTVALSALSNEARKEISTYWDKSFKEIGSENVWIPTTSAGIQQCAVSITGTTPKANVKHPHGIVD
jgi:hypothetical protein